MPRERRTRSGAASNRGTENAGSNRRNRAAALQMRASTRNQPLTPTRVNTPSIIPRLFVKFSFADRISAPQQEVMAQTLRQHILYALKSFQDRQGSSRIEGSSLQAKFPSQVQFADFYDLAHRMTIHATRPSVYDVSRHAIHDFFDLFASGELTT